MPYEYFYGEQAEQFSFYRIPKILFTDEKFCEISTDAKVLYGLLLDRMSLSVRNGWMDEKGRVYIIFTVEEIMAALRCAEQKAAKLLSELEKKVGLIERKRQGLGKPNLIFVKNFATVQSQSQVLNCENHNSGSVIIENQELRKSQGINTDISNTDLSDTDPIHSGGDEEWAACRKYFKEQLDFEVLLGDYPDDREVLNEILELLVDTVCSRREVIRIAGDDKPAGVVKGQLMKLNYNHICFVLRSMREKTTRVRNMRQYLLAALYNAPMTIKNYYASLVSHDMAAGVV